MKRARRVFAIGAILTATAFFVAISACVIDLEPPLAPASDAASAPDSATDTGIDAYVADANIVDANDAGSSASECVDPTDCPAPSGPAAGCVSTACTSGRCVYDLCGASTAAACTVSQCTTDDGGTCGPSAPTSYLGYVSFPRVSDVVFSQLPCGDITHCSTLVFPYYFYADVDPVNATYTIDAYSVAVPELTPLPVPVGINFKPSQVLRSGNRLWVIGVVNAGAVEIAWLDLPRIPTDVAFAPSQQAVYLSTGTTQPVAYPAPNSQIFLAVGGGSQIAMFTDSTSTSATAPLQFFSGATTLVATSNASAVYFTQVTNTGKFSRQTNAGTSSAGIVVTGPEETTAQERLTSASAAELALAQDEVGDLGFAAPYGADVIVDGGATYPATTEIKFGWLLEGTGAPTLNGSTTQAIAFDGGVATTARTLGSATIPDNANAFVLAIHPTLGNLQLALLDHVDGGVSTRTSYATSLNVAPSYGVTAQPYFPVLSRVALFSSQGQAYLVGAESAGDGGAPDIVVYPLAPSCALDGGM